MGLCWHCSFRFICSSPVLTVLAKLSEPKLSQLSSEDEDVSMGISLVLRKVVKVLLPEQRRCKRAVLSLLPIWAPAVRRSAGAHPYSTSLHRCQWGLPTPGKPPVVCEHSTPPPCRTSTIKQNIPRVQVGTGSRLIGFTSFYRRALFALHKYFF